MSGNRKPRPKGRKFSVVIISAILLSLGMIAGIVAAFNEIDLAWLAVTLPVLAGVFPTYIAGNAYQHGERLKNSMGGIK